MILFVEDPENPAPGVIFAVNVSNSVVGEVIGEYRPPGESNEPSQEMVAAAEDAGINPDLTINGQVYLLDAIYEPAGTTTNGFVTLFSSGPEQDAAFLLGRDKRRLELFIYEALSRSQSAGKSPPAFVRQPGKTPRVCRLAAYTIPPADSRYSP